ncbi:MAG TPA: SxtJ family membrane protein [Gemmatimonadaceae bacterium]|nr:SxtJ family membrane protein [Gemmatimonadaceae bacterium]
MTRAEGRKFGLTVGGAFLVLAGISLWRGHRIPVVVLGALGAVLVLAALAIPGHLGPVQRGWMALAEAISKVTTPIFMAVIYFVVVTPAAVMVRTFGHRPLRRELHDGSYWVRRPAGKRAGDITRQF